MNNGLIPVQLAYIDLLEVSLLPASYNAQSTNQPILPLLQRESMNVKYLNGRTVVGKNKGLVYTRARDEKGILKGRLERVEDSLAQVQDTNRRLESKLSRRQSEVDHLRNCTVDYKYLQNQFISTYTRDKVKNATPTNLHYIHGTWRKPFSPWGGGNTKLFITTLLGLRCSGKYLDEIKILEDLTPPPRTVYWGVPNLSIINGYG